MIWGGGVGGTELLLVRGLVYLGVFMKVGGWV